MPTNIVPKQDGHAMTESTDPQYPHWAASVPAAAPQLGQLSEVAIIEARRVFDAASGPTQLQLREGVGTTANCE
jgi:hypothetical protein